MSQSLKTTLKDSSLKTNSSVPKSRINQKRMSERFDVYDGEIMIYKTTNSGDVWQMRMWIGSEKKYVRESLRTRNKIEATEEAKRRFLNYNHLVKNGQKIFSITTNELREKYLSYVDELVRSGQLSKGRQTNIKVFTKHYIEFIGKNRKIANIDRKEFQGYRAHRQKDKSDIKMSVVVNESITIKQMYRWAENEGLISNYKPDFGVIKVPKDDTVRDGFTIKEYKQLTDVASKWYQKVPSNYLKFEEETFYRKSIRDFILLMSNYGFRTGELILVKYKDINYKTGKRADVTIPATNTKVRKSRITGGLRGDVFKRKSEYSKPFNQPDNFLFNEFNSPKNISRYVIYDYFSKLVKEVKDKYPDYDTTKTLYSLRHFFITWHLTIGKMNVYDLARVAGTSLKQIQDHYDHVSQTHRIDEMLSFSKNRRIDDNFQMISIEDHLIDE
jgi:integrase